MSNRIALTNGVNTTTVKQGFSWTFLFFDFLVPLVHGRVGEALKVFALVWLLGVLTFGVLTLVLKCIWASKYNAHRIDQLIAAGYTPVNK